MAILQESKDNAENKLLLSMLSYIENEPQVSQRSLSSRLGVAIGLVNAYLKRCVQKGWVKVQQVPAKRYAYYVTPKGFIEKSKLTVEYLSSSFHFLREAQNQFFTLFQHCEALGYGRVLLVGKGELAEIALQVAKRMTLQVEVLALEDKPFFQYDAYIIADIETPQQTYDYLLEWVSKEKILAPTLLHISVAKQPRGVSFD